MSTAIFERMYSVRQVAGILGVTRQYVYLLIKRGRLPVYRFDGLNGRQCFRVGAKDLSAYKKGLGFRSTGRQDLKPAVRKRLLGLLRENGGNIESRSRDDFGKLLGVSGRTVYSVVTGLKREGLLTVRIKRLGRGKGAITTYSLTERAKSTGVGDSSAGN